MGIPNISSISDCMDDIVLIVYGRRAWTPGAANILSRENYRTLFYISQTLARAPLHTEQRSR